MLHQHTGLLGNTGNVLALNLMSPECYLLESSIVSFREDDLFYLRQKKGGGASFGIKALSEIPQSFWWELYETGQWEEKQDN